MGKLHDLAKRSRLKTAAELRTILGKSYAPCPACASTYFSAPPVGRVLCWGCDHEELERAPRGRLDFCLVIEDGRPIAIELSEERRRRLREGKQGVCRIDRDDGTYKIFTIDRDDGTYKIFTTADDIIPNHLLTEEWYERLPAPFSGATA